MAIITKPKVNKNQAASFTLDKDELALVASVVGNAYFADPANWKTIRLRYESSVGGQREIVVFDATGVGSTTTGEFLVSERARDEFLVRKITIEDFDGGYHDIMRTELNEEEFDIFFNLILGYSLYSWGSTDSSYSNTGFSPGTPGTSSVPQRVPGMDANEVSKISRSNNKLVVVKSDGTLWGTGSNTGGELGLGTSISSVNVFTQIGTDTDWKDVFAFNECTFAIKTDGTLYATGRFSGGASGNGQSLAYYGYTTPNQTFVQLSAATDWKSVFMSQDQTGFFSAYYSLAVKTDGTLWATGNNSWGQLGLGNTTSINTWTQVGTDTDWKEVKACGAVSTAIKENGKMYISGTSRSLSGGAIENNYINNIRTVGAPTNQFSEVLVIDNIKAFDVISNAGDSESCAVIKNNGTLWGIGYNRLGRLGIGFTGQQITTFTQAGVDTDWKKVELMDSMGLAQKENDIIYASGSSAGFFLGYFNGSGFTTFTAPVNPVSVSSFAVSPNHFIALKALPSGFKRNVFSVFNQGFKIGTTAIDNTSIYSISSNYIASFAAFESNSALSFVWVGGSDSLVAEDRPSNVSLKFQQKGTSLSPNYIVIDLGAERTFESLYAFTGSSNSSSPNCNRLAVDVASNNALNIASSPNWTAVTFTNPALELENGYLKVADVNSVAGVDPAAGIATFAPVTARYIKIRCYYEGSGTTTPYFYGIKLF
jgi:alpha-tubulin suppressor-like RCC1 family protein